jgi:hypothetical protein
VSILKVLSICASLGWGALLVGCKMSPAGTESGPDHTVACFIQVEASVPGVTIETNHVIAGTAPLTLKVFADVTDTFHNFGSPEFVLTAKPDSTNYFTQTRTFRTGKGSTPGDRVPGLVFFDMSQRSGSMLIDSIPYR